MNFRQLEAFVYTVNYKSFSKAGKKLFLSQPTVSSHIYSLEKELGQKLILRSTKKFELTESGKRLYNYAINILALKSKAEKELSGEYQNEIHIGASSVPSYYLLPKILPLYLKQNPKTIYYCTQNDSLDILEKIQNGVFDLGFVGTKVDEKCEYVFLAEDELVIVTPNNENYRNLVSKNSLELLLKSPFIIRNDHSGTLIETEKFLDNLGYNLNDLNVVLHMNDTESIIECVVNGLGVAILSKNMVENLKNENKILTFENDKKWIRNLYLIYRKDKLINDNLKNFVRFITEKKWL